MRTGEFPMHFTGDIDLRVRRFWTIVVGSMTTPPLAFMSRAVDPKKRTTTSDPKSASRVLMGQPIVASKREFSPS
ncbi:hypothetical protein TWF569_000874 [Orbilia oligospora]|nr:hypothetical protein TWF569_000874 [Orbilia oligospora]